MQMPPPPIVLQLNMQHCSTVSHRSRRVYDHSSLLLPIPTLQRICDKEATNSELDAADATIFDLCGRGLQVLLMFLMLGNQVSVCTINYLAVSNRAIVCAECTAGLWQHFPSF
jgi:hypothetical protein